MKLSDSNVSFFFTFSNISGNGNPKKNPFISENGNPKKVLMFLEMELLNPCSKNTKNSLQKNASYSRTQKFLIIHEGETQKKLLMFQKVNFPTGKVKTTHS